MAHKNVAGWVLALVAAWPPASWSQGEVRWPGSGLGLSPGRSMQPVCATVALPCLAQPAAAPLLASRDFSRRLELQVAPVDLGWTGRLGLQRSQGLNVGVVGRASLLDDVGVYGRVGAFSRAPGAFRAPGEAGVGLAYGVGVSWDITPRASAVLGWENDYRFAGERDPVRATSLGLHWRY